MKHFRARGRTVRRLPGQMNKTEQEYANVLTAQGIKHRFEAITLRLADNTRFTPDFQCFDDEGYIEFREVKAERSDGKLLIEDDAAVKIKVAAEMYPEFKFVLCSKATKKNGGGWTMKEV